LLLYPARADEVEHAWFFSNIPVRLSMQRCALSLLPNLEMTIAETIARAKT